MAEATDTPEADVRFGAEKLGVASGSRLYLSIDPFAWAGLGPRGARLDAVAALRWSEVREIERQIEQSIVTAFAKGHVLSAWVVPEVDLDAGPLLAASLASTEAVNAVESARLLADAERQSIETGLTSIRATVATHLAWIEDGSSPTLPIAFHARAIQTASSDPAYLNDERA